MTGEDPLSPAPAGKDLPFGSEPIDRASIAPTSDAVRDHDPIDDIPFDEGDPNHDDPSSRWDADDERRRKDCFAPPRDPVECYCLHCQRTFMSDKIWLQRVIGDRDGMDGFWMCPNNNCSGAGFTFDIFPTDPDHPANAGWFDDDEGEYDPEEDEALDELDPDDVGGGDEATAEYDPHESKYKQLDEEMGDADDDITEGDEWKLGLAPGEQVPPQMYWSENSRKEWEAAQADYDAPDRRPRELDWTRREDERGGIKEDDIPF